MECPDPNQGRLGDDVESISLGQSSLTVSRLVYGCMRICGDGSSGDLEKGRRAIRAALDAGYTQFDHADIYAGGTSEALFGELLRERPSIRDDIVLIDKCGIRPAGSPDVNSPQRYDFSKLHITASVNGSLERLGTEKLDLLLLHRPDYLMRPDEVADAFADLKQSGKVDYFGVSNFSPSQVELLQSAIDTPLLVNQVELNLHNIERLHDGTLDQCLRLKMTPQAWCPVAGIAYTAWGNTFGASDEARLRTEVSRQAQQYDCSETQLALAWILAHPATIAPVVGSTTPSRIAESVAALDVRYSREDWYRLLEARNGAPVP